MTSTLWSLFLSFVSRNFWILIYNVVYDLNIGLNDVIYCEFVVDLLGFIVFVLWKVFIATIIVLFFFLFLLFKFFSLKLEVVFDHFDNFILVFVGDLFVSFSINFVEELLCLRLGHWNSFIFLYASTFCNSFIFAFSWFCMIHFFVEKLLYWLSWLALLFFNFSFILYF